MNAGRLSTPSDVQSVRPCASTTETFTSVAAALEVVVDRRSARRVLADEILLAADVRIVREVSDVRDRRTRREQI